MKIIPNHCAFVAGNSKVPRVFAERIFEKLSTEELKTRTGKIIFKQGDETEVQSTKITNISEISSQTYFKMLVQNQVYDQLLAFKTNYSEEIKEMSEELKMIIVIMKDINYQLTNTDTKPNIKHIPLKNFCNGVKFATNNLKEIMKNIRILINSVNNENIERKLLFINLTLQSQYCEFQDIKQDCQ